MLKMRMNPIGFFAENGCKNVTGYIVFSTRTKPRLPTTLHDVFMFVIIHGRSVTTKCRTKDSEGTDVRYVKQKKSSE